MQRVPLNHVRPGQAFDQSIFLSTGQKLLGPGVELTQRHLTAIRNSGEMELLLAESVEELAAAGVLRFCDAGKLRVGQRDHGGLIAAGGDMLLEPGEAVEQHHLDALRASGQGFIARPVQHPKPANDADTPSVKERILLADALVEELEAEVDGWSLRIRPVKKPPSGGCGSVGDGEWDDPKRLARRRDIGVATIRDVYARIEAGLDVPPAELDPLLDRLMADLAAHPTRFTQLALLCPRREDYLPDHAVTVTVLAMAIAAGLGWSDDDTRRVGLAGLTFDLGMLLIPERIRVGACELSDIDRGRVRRHTAFTLSMLRHMPGLDPMIRLATVQHHERENGSGYPFGRRKEAIGDLARVLAVADTFAAATEPRHYRQGKLPYTAMEEIVRGASTMQYWPPAVRALVRAAGLFPVGSYVKLSSGATAHVLACNPNAIDRPLVQVMKKDGSPDADPLDLSTAADAPTVVRAIAA